MIKITDKKQCCGCYACANTCPNGSLSMKYDEEGFAYPEINKDSCIDCGLCERVCPIQNSFEQKGTLPEGYAAYNTDNEIRSGSSSGGIFSLLAEDVIQSGGVVFGAVLSDDCKSVRHIAVEKAEGLAGLRGSKYLQSEIGDSYKQVKGVLREGRKVLFTGTPCQAEALKRYLKEDYNNLLIVDIICHGIPSPKVWKKYVSYREKCAGAPAQRIFFRHKKYGWKKFSVLFEFTNNTEYVQWFNEDLFGRGFISNLFFRPACETCRFKKVSRESDITMSDFWGIQNVVPQLDDDLGTSLILVHSSKGRAAIENIKGRLKMEKVDTVKALKGNPYVKQSLKPNKLRNKFFSDIEKYDFDELICRYAKPQKTVKGRIAGILKKIHLWEFAKKITGRG